MIFVVIGILVVVLVLLFTDWQGLAFRRGGKKVVAPKKTKPEKAPISLPDSKKKEEFNFDPPQEIKEVVEVRHPNAEIDKMLADADIHFRKGEIKAAEDLYVQVAAKDPRCSKAYSRLGVIYLEHGEDWEDAEAAFRQALKIEPENGFILNNLGLVLYHQDKYADAIRHFEQAVRQDEFNAARHANLGMGYMAIRQYAKAESAFKKALKLAPNEMEYKDLLNESIEKKKAHKTMVRH